MDGAPRRGVLYDVHEKLRSDRNPATFRTGLAAARRAALFGSVARGDNSPDSHIDIMVEVDPDACITIFDYVNLKEYIAGLFEEPVDVVNREALKPHVRPVATADAIYAF